MEAWIRFAILCALLPLSNLVPAAESAAAPSAGTHWRCWYDQQVHINCLIDLEPQAGNPAIESLAAELPQIVKLMRSNPAALRNRVIYIPLFSPPYESMDFTATLAKAAVCGARRDCTVNFTSRPPQPEEILALLNRNAPAMGRDGAQELARFADE